MCPIEAHDREHPTINYDTSSGGGIPLTSNSTKDVLVSFGLPLNPIYIWIKSFKTIYLHQTIIYYEYMHDLFKKKPTTLL